MAGLARKGNQYQRIPSPGGMTGEQASSVYQGFYGELPMPATDYTTSATALKSLEVVPSVAPNSANAAVTSRRDNRWGYLASDGQVPRTDVTCPVYESPRSSEFQPILHGPIFNYILNAFLYRAGGYPAASVMNGGLHNLALSTRVDQLVTRASGGPGPGAMGPAPRFKSVQKVPRFSTMPKSYNTESAPS